MPSETVDLIYLDPPFNTRATHSGVRGTVAEDATFDDRWAADGGDLREAAGGQPALAALLGEVLDAEDAAYLAMLVPRMREIHRLLKPTGSVYLHCDPTMSHAVKLVLDVLFGKKNFRNEIIWYYRNASRGKRRFARAHDVVFWYSKTDDYVFNREKLLLPFLSERTKWNYTKGRQKGKPMPAGKTPDDVIDLAAINSMSKERTGYPTQKPLALLTRIVKAGSNEDDLVLDPFCGSGTTLLAASMLARRWLGMDVSAAAVRVASARLKV